LCPQPRHRWQQQCHCGGNDSGNGLGNPHSHQLWPILMQPNGWPAADTSCDMCAESFLEDGETHDRGRTATKVCPSARCWFSWLSRYADSHICIRTPTQHNKNNKNNTSARVQRLQRLGGNRGLIARADVISLVPIRRMCSNVQEGTIYTHSDDSCFRARRLNRSPGSLRQESVHRSHVRQTLALPIRHHGDVSATAPSPLVV
jgi:hypothetical protein